MLEAPGLHCGLSLRAQEANSHAALSLKSVGFFPQLRGGCWILWRQEGRSQLVPSADDSHTATLWCGPSERPSSPWQPPSVIQNAQRYLQPRPGGRDLSQSEAKPPWTRKTGTTLRSAEARMAGAETRCSHGPLQRLRAPRAHVVCPHMAHTRGCILPPCPHWRFWWQGLEGEATFKLT